MCRFAEGLGAAKRGAALKFLNNANDRIFSGCKRFLLQSAESQTECNNSEQLVLQLQHTLDQQKEDLCQVIQTKQKV